MIISMRIFSKKAREPTPSPYIGRIGSSEGIQTLDSRKSWQFDVLRQLRMRPNAADAIDLLGKNNPDMSMAIGNLIYLSNQGHTMEFYQEGQRLQEAENEWTEFCRRVYSMSSSGLDGLVDALHKSSFTRSGMAFEVVVTKNGMDIEDVYLIDPMSIQWRLETRSGKEVYVPYQIARGKSVDLSTGNFFWIPFDPDIGSPVGNLMLQSAIGAIDQQMELYQNLNTVLFRIGTPRYDIKLDTARVAESAPVQTKNDSKNLIEYITATVENVKNAFLNIGVKNDFVHTDDSDVKVIGGGTGMNGVDARAFREISDTQVLNGTHMLGVLMNRYDSKTNALSSTEFKIMVNKIDARRRDSKRAIEAIANLWLRVRGYNATAKFTHNPIEWQTLLDKYNALLKKQEYLRKGEEYRWIDSNRAAAEAMGTVMPTGDSEFPVGFQYVKSGLNSNENDSTNEKEGEENAD